MMMAASGADNGTDGAPPTLRALPEGTYMESSVKALVGVDVRQVMGRDRFLARGQALHLRRMGAQTLREFGAVQTAQTALARVAPGGVAHTPAAWKLLPPALRDDMGAACAALRAWDERDGACLLPGLASASDVLYALLCDEPLIADLKAHAPAHVAELATCLEYALWAEDCNWTLLKKRAAAPHGERSGSSAWYEDRQWDAAAVDAAALSAFDQRVMRLSSSAGGATTTTKWEAPWLPVFWALNNALKTKSKSKKLGAAGLRRWFTVTPPDAGTLIAWRHREPLRLVRAALVACDVLGNDDRMRALHDELAPVAAYGVSLAATGVGRDATQAVIRGAEAELVRAWGRASGGGDVDAFVRTHMLGAADAAAEAAERMVARWFAPGRVAAMAAAAAAGIVLDQGLIDFAVARSPAHVARLARPALLALYPVLVLAAQRVLAAGGLWPAPAAHNSASAAAPPAPPAAPAAPAPPQAAAQANDGADAPPGPQTSAAFRGLFVVARRRQAARGRI